jgi:hypothetical protein
MQQKIPKAYKSDCLGDKKKKEKQIIKIRVKNIILMI